MQSSKKCRKVNIKNIDINRLQKDANSEEIRNALASEIASARNQNIDATPTVLINMEKVVGNIPYYALQEKLIGLGATEKK